jgi:signal transduction histidine kinase
VRRDEIWTITGGASLALLLWIGIAVLIWTEQAEGERRINRFGETLVGGIAGQTDRTLGAADRLLRVLADLAAKAAAKPDGFDLRQFDLKALDTAARLSDRLVPIFAVADADGHIVQSTLPGPLDGLDIAGSEHFRLQAEHRVNGLYVSAPVLGRTTGHWTVLLSRAINRPDGSFGGIVIGSLDPAVLRKVYAGVDLGPSGTTALLGEDGRIRVRAFTGGAPVAELGLTDEGADQPDAADRFDPQLSDFALSGELTPLERDEPAAAGQPPVRRLYLARRLADYPLVALIGIDKRIVGDALFKERVFHITLGLTVTALITFFTIFLTYRLRRQAAAEELLREAIEGMPDGFVLFDPQDRLITWNRRYETIFPYLKPILRPGIRFAEVASYAAHFVTGSDDEAVRDGWIKWRVDRHFSREPTFNQSLADGRMLETAERTTADGGIVSVTRDITVLRQGEATLAASEARFRDFAMLAGDWFWETDALHRFIFVSERAGRARIVAANLPRLDRLAEGNAVLQDALLTQSGFRNQILTVPDEGDGAPLVMTGMAVRDSEGKFMGYRGAARSLAGQRAAELALRAEIVAEQRQAQAALLGDMADRLRAALDEPAETGATLAQLADAAEELAALQRGDIRLARGWFQFETTLAAVKMALAEPARRRQLRFETHYATGPVPPLWGDETRIRRLIALLADNAIRHTGDPAAASPGIVTFVIGLERQEGGRCALVVEIHDQGAGIPSWAQPGLFERSGGFGLKIFRELVLLMAGEFGMTSETGIGSTFWFRLPLEADSASE